MAAGARPRRATQRCGRSRRRHVDEHRRLVRATVGLDPPDRAGAPDRADARLLEKAGTEALGPAFERERRAVGQRRAVAATDDGTDAMVRDRRHQAAKLGLPDQLLVLEAERPDRVDPAAQDLEL